MTILVEAAKDAAPGPTDRAGPLLLAVRLANEPNPFGRIDAASRWEGFRYEVMSAAGGADPVEECRLGAQGSEALATEMTGAAS